MFFSADKVAEITRLCDQLQRLNQLYGEQTEVKKGSFDYDTVIELLQQAEKTIDQTVRFERPENLPENIPWCPIPWRGEDDDIDPYVYESMVQNP